MKMGGPRGAGRRDVFVSYSPADERWATWIGWELEAAGYRTLLQAWDFVPGTDFIDFMDRGVLEAGVVLALLSGRYLRSQYCRAEWQAALRAGKLITVRIEDCELDGLLAPITYIDLLGADSAEESRRRLLTRLRHALEGSARPAVDPGYPPLEPPGRRPPEESLPGAPVRRRPGAAPSYPLDPPEHAGPRTAVSVLHVAGPRFGRGLDAGTASELQARIWAEVIRLTDDGVPKPDLIVVSGDLTESARPRQMDQALEFLTGLRVVMGLGPHRLAVVPGVGDVSRPACMAYFAQCEDREVRAVPPYYPKFGHYADLFGRLYQDLDGPVFDAAQPWTLFEVADLGVVIAGINSTIAINHRPEEDHGLIGEPQIPWFASRLRRYEQDGWLRIGLMRHDPANGAGRAGLPAGDSAAFDGLLGPRINLVLHGPGPGGAHAGSLPSGVPALPAAGPAASEIVVITAEGLRRWSIGGERPETLERRWHACDATFRPPHAEAAAAPESPPEPERAPDPASLLLERIGEVCRVRHEHVKVRRIESARNQLRLVREEDGILTMWRIGAHVGTPSREDLEDFLAGDPEPGSELVYEGPSPGPALREEALRRGVRLRSFLEFQGLLDLSGYVTQQTRDLGTDPVYPPGLYVPQRYSVLDRGPAPVREDLVGELLRLAADDHGRFVLILGDFGRGKTYALREVARRIAESLPHLVPILIDLRALDKAHTVEGLVAAHLANHGEELSLRAFQYMLRQGRIVLLFDGFDELVTRLTFDRAGEHLTTLLRAAQDEAKVFVASRTQHFKSHAQVLTTMGQQVGALPSRRILLVEPFTTAQVRTFLANRYQGSVREADRRLRLIDAIENLAALAQNPRMLSFIADLDDDLLRSAAQAGGTISAAVLYREILDRWLTGEAKRAQGGSGSPSGLTAGELWTAVTTLALRIWETGEPFLALGDLNEVAEGLANLVQTPLTPDQTAYAIGAGSLLVRTEDETFGFIHGSVAEWLVARKIADGLPGDPAELHRRPLSQLTVEFLCDLADPRACREWASRTVGSASEGEVARANAGRIVARLRTLPTTDLRGASLRDQDLSHRELRGVDMTGADLAGARLIGADLTGAVLRGASLTDVRLDEARLVGADLTGADLRRARLPEADLTRATFTGSRWSRAVLINAQGVPDADELRGAAIYPGQPVETEFAPAAIGVRHGFHAEFGRIPDALAYSSDGTLLAIGNDDGGVLICDAATGRPVRTLLRHRGRVYAVRYGPDDRVLATGASDGVVRLWDPASGRRLQALEGHEGWAWPIVISPSGELLVTGDANGVLRLWSAETGACLWEASAGGSPMYTAAFQPDGSRLVTGSRDGTVHGWDVRAGTARPLLTNDQGAVYRVALAPSGDLLAVAGAGEYLRLVDPRDGHVVHDLGGHHERVYVAAFDPAGSLLATGDTSGGLRLWDAASGRCRSVLAGHATAIYSVAFRPDGEVLASGDRAGGLLLWSLPEGRLLRSLDGHTGSIWPLAFRPDGRQLAAADDQSVVRLWSPDTGESEHVLTGHGRRVMSVSFSGDGRSLAASGNDGVVRLWDTATGVMRSELSGTGGRLVRLEAAVFGPRGSLLATVGNDARINLVDVATGRDERHLDVDTPAVWAMAIDPKEQLIATANDDDTVRLWWRMTGLLHRNLAEHRGRVRSIAFHPDGSLLATGCDDRKIRLWSVESGALVATLEGHEDRVYAVSFSADGALLASASWDGTARVWSTGDRSTIHVLRGHAGRLWTAAFSTAEPLLATGGDDLVVRLWDAVRGVQVVRLEGHTRGIWSLAFSPDGSLLASGGDDGTARLWTLGERRTLRLTLLGLPEGGWAALAPNGRYKVSGDPAGQFWHVIGMCRFEPGELDPHLAAVGQVPLDEPF